MSAAADTSSSTDADGADDAGRAGRLRAPLRFARDLLPVSEALGAGATNVMPNARGGRQFGVLRQEAVSGIHRVSTRTAGGGDDVTDRQVRAYRVSDVAIW